MPKTMTYTGTLVIEECYKCHITFAMPADLQKRARADNSISFYCPLGHGQVYSKSEVQELQEQVDAANRARVQAARDRDAAWTAASAARDQAQAAERSARAHKGHATRLRNRVKAGICPVDGCRRHFNDLADHMETKHPTYAAEPPVD